MKKYISIILSIIMILATTTFAFAEDVQSVNDNQRNFSITVVDQDGNGISDANIFLYSFLEDKIVIRGTTDENGKEVLQYSPAEMRNVKQREYVDYLIYIHKDGFAPMEYNLTKCYVDPLVALKEEREAADRTNKEPIEVTLEKTQSLETQRLQSKNTIETQTMKKIKNQLIEDNQLSKDNPICILKSEDFDNYVKKGVISPTEVKTISNIVPMATTSSGLRNRQVPIGIFHISKHVKLDVTFYATDSLKVDVGMQNPATGAVSISGSRERGLNTKSEYARFSTTEASAKKTYYTGADFEEWTVVQYYGLSYKYIGIKQIHGGTETGKSSSCSSCNVAYDKVKSDTYGTYISIPSGAVTIEQFRNKTANVGAKANVAGTFKVSLGVTRKTGTSTAIKYIPNSGYKAKIYNKDTATWHCTDKAS